MSGTQLKEWIEHFLFGTKSLPKGPPPPEIRSVLIRMEAENINWRHIVKNGGFTVQSYYIHGDLNLLIDRLEKQLLLKEHGNEYDDGEDDPSSSFSSSSVGFKTSAVRRFANQLEVLLARHHHHEPANLQSLLLPHVTAEDDHILQQFMRGFNNTAAATTIGHLEYKSAQFWGEVSRRLLMHRRPFDKNLAPVPSTSSFQAERAVLLYDVTSQSRGRHWDPASMHLVPHSEHVDSVHWQTDSLLETFMLRHPSHLLSRSVRGILKRAVGQILDGTRPSIFSRLEKDEDEEVADLDLFLANIDAVHSTIRKVPPLPDTVPPKVVDVFHRLLVLAEKDGLWQTAAATSSSSPLKTTTPLFTGMDIFLLMDRLDVAERSLQRMKEYYYYHNDNGNTTG